MILEDVLRVFSLEKISGNKAFGKVSVEGELDRFGVTAMGQKWN